MLMMLSFLSFFLSFFFAAFFLCLGCFLLVCRFPLECIETMSRKVCETRARITKGERRQPGMEGPSAKMEPDNLRAPLR